MYQLIYSFIDNLSFPQQATTSGAEFTFISIRNYSMIISVSVLV